MGQRRQLPILALSGQQLPADRAVDGGGSEHLARQRLLFHKLILGVRQPEQGLERAVLLQAERRQISPVQVRPVGPIVVAGLA